MGWLIDCMRISYLCQNNHSGLDQSRETNARCTVKDRSNLVCGHKQSYRQEVSLRNPAGMGDRPLHLTCLSQSTRTSPDRKAYRRVGGGPCGTATISIEPQSHPDPRKQKSEYEIPLLTKPLRPIWVDPSTTALPSFSGSQTFIPLICLSASKQIREGLERRKNGFAYVQGSGDDHELWGRYATLRSHKTPPASESFQGTDTRCFLVFSVDPPLHFEK